MRAEFADEALGEDGADGGGDEEGFDADVGETGDGGGCVVGVECGEDEVTGEGGVDGDVGGFGIANFPDHDNVGGLAEHGAECGAEGHADVGFDHDLVDAREFVFDGIFDGDDFAVGAVDDVEAGVEGGGFTGAGGAGDEDDAVGEFEEGLELCLVVGEEAEFGEAEEEGGFIEDTHDHGFAMVGGDGGDAEVDFLVAHFELDTSVLREAFFGDGHGAAHDFEAGDDGGEEFFGMGVDVDEFAIDAITDADGCFEGFDVDVGCAEAEGFGEGLLDEADDGCVVAVGSGFEITGGDLEGVLGGL